MKRSIKNINYNNEKKYREILKIIIKNNYLLIFFKEMKKSRRNKEEGTYKLKPQTSIIIMVINMIISNLVYIL